MVVIEEGQNVKRQAKNYKVEDSVRMEIQAIKIIHLIKTDYHTFMKSLVQNCDNHFYFGPYLIRSEATNLLLSQGFQPRGHN